MSVRVRPLSKRQRIQLAVFLCKNSPSREVLADIANCDPSYAVRVKHAFDSTEFDVDSLPVTDDNPQLHEIVSILEETGYGIDKEQGIESGMVASDDELRWAVEAEKSVFRNLTGGMFPV